MLSEDCLGRVAIVKRKDGLFCLYARWRWPVEYQQALGIANAEDVRWTKDYDPGLYYDSMHGIEAEPEPGIYSSIEEAEREARIMLALGDN